MDFERLDRNTIVGLFAMAVGILVVANDFTALSVAIPAIEKSFNTDVTTAQWVINNYAMVATAGSLAEEIRSAFLVNGSLAVISVLIALAFIGGPVDTSRVRVLQHHHRAHT